MPRFELMNDVEASFCRENYVILSRANLTEAFNLEFSRNLTVGQMTSWLKNRGVKSGRTGYFPKGHVSAYKTPKGTINGGTFKHGNTPHNRRGPGYESTDKYGFVWVCIKEQNPYTGAPTMMKQKHRIVWEEAHGAIPPGMLIKFIDGDRSNCFLENLTLCERDTAPRLRKLKNMPKELRLSAILSARVESAIVRRSKK